MTENTHFPGILTPMAKLQSGTAQALRHVGRLLRALRERAELTQGELAQRISSDIRARVDTARISDVERGRTDAQFSTLDRHARALGAAGGIVELVTTEGDADVPELLRAWRVLPDAAARETALEIIVRRAFPGRGQPLKPPALTEADARVLAASHRLRATNPQVWDLWLQMGEQQAAAPGAAAKRPNTHRR